MAETGTILDYLQHGASTELEPGDAQVAYKEGRPSEHEYGTYYYAPWEPVADGFAEHSRRNVRALASTGEPVFLRSFMARIGAYEDSEEFRSIEELLKPLLRASISRPRVEIYQLVPSDSNLHRYTGFGHPYLTEEDNARVNRFRIFYTVWERDRANRGQLQMLQRVGQNWTACEANRSMLVRGGLDPAKVRVVPVPFFPDDPHLALQGREPAIDPVRFYHIGKWEPRKAQDRIIRAFLRAFRPGEAVLMMKTSELRSAITGYPQGPQIAVHEALGDEEVRQQGWTIHNVNVGFKLVVQRLPAAMLVNMHRAGDVYVSLSQGEGWDMPAFDAKLSGNTLLYTPSGGPADFAGPTDVRVASTEPTADAHRFYGWGEGTRYITDYELEAAVDGFRLAAAVARNRRKIPDRDLSEFAAANVGARMLRYLTEMLPVRQGDATDSPSP